MSRAGRGIALAMAILALATSARAQVCTGNIVLNSQDDVNAFACSEVTGGLVIAGADITDLAGLASLNSVGGNLSISGSTVLTSLSGLEGLASVGRSLEIRNNAALESLDGLGSLSSVEGSVWINENASLVSLEGVESLASAGAFDITYNIALTSLSGLEGLTSVDGLLLIDVNPALVSLDGLSRLMSVGDLFIYGNGVLRSIDALRNLVSVKGRLESFSNRSLRACSCGLEGLITDGVFTGVRRVNVSIFNNDPDGRCDSIFAVVATPCERPVACADGAALIFNQTTFDTDGEESPNGEVVGLQNLGESTIDLATCSFAAFDPFTEQVTFATGLEGSVDGVDGDMVSEVLIRSVGEGSLLPEGSIPDGPGALVVVEGEIPVGASVADVLPVLISGIVYRTEDEIVGIYSDASSAATSTDDFLSALASLANSVAEQDGAGEINLEVVAAPNPLRDRSTIAFGVPEAADVRVAVYNALGRQVALLAEAPYAAGRHAVTFDAQDLPAGVYVIRATVGAETQSARVTLAR